jgi:membrane protease YdiL (CAAX protease family)
MNARTPGAARDLLQAAVAFGLWTAVVQLGWLPMQYGLGALALLAVAWPPRVAWGRPAVGAVLGRYLPFAVVWLAFLIVYLRAMHALGWTVPVQPMLKQLADQGLATRDCAMLCTTIVVLGPLAEEFVYRGCLWTGLAVAAPRGVVHAVVAVLFGLAHGPYYALPIAVLGAFFGWLRARHDALLPSVVAHMFHNGLTVFVTLAWPGHLALLYPAPAGS